MKFCPSKESYIYVYIYFFFSLIAKFVLSLHLLYNKNNEKNLFGFCIVLEGVRDMNIDKRYGMGIEMETWIRPKFNCDLGV